MATINPPLYLQARTDHSAFSFRRLNQAILQLSAGAAANATDLLVTERGAGANLTIDVATGQGFVAELATYPGYYMVDNQGTLNKAIAPADPTDPRIDTVIIRVQDTEDNSPDGSDIFTIEVLVGDTHPTTPVKAPIPATYQATELATVAVGAAAGSIVDANITDTRVVIESVADVAADLVLTDANVATNVTNIGTNDSEIQALEDDTAAITRSGTTTTITDTTLVDVNAATITLDAATINLDASGTLLVAAATLVDLNATTVTLDATTANVDGSTRVNILSASTVDIDATTEIILDSAAVTVVGDLDIEGDVLTVSDGTNNGTLSAVAASFEMESQTGDRIDFIAAGTNSLRLTTGGTVQITATGTSDTGHDVKASGTAVAGTLRALSIFSSSERWKEEIEKVNNAATAAKHKGIAPITYKSTHKADVEDGRAGPFLGFSAENLYEIDPLLTTVDDEGLPNGVRHLSITAFLVATVNDLQARLDAAGL
jgi:hypothetical protein